MQQNVCPTFADVAVLQEKLSELHLDVTEIKGALNALTQAITKLALVEERLTANMQSIDRAFKDLEKLDDRMLSFESRIASLERSDALHSRSNRYLDMGIFALAGAALTFVAKKVGLL